MEVAVVGAGAAGLAAAMRLSARGAAVTLLERDGRAGGKLRTELVDTARVDVGVQLVSSTHTALHALTAEAGAAELLQRSPGRDALWRKDRPQSITYGSVASMVASGALPTTLKLKMAARYLPYLNRHARTLDANDPAMTGGLALDTESIGEWGRREVGDEFV
ncbi:MAG TPA: FAD-dependent oxidoreductase, partial [Longimicrobiales bacterium]|nr:FAD-dependent oxidoreductase [Longimicrobiales bacterium]